MARRPLNDEQAAAVEAIRNAARDEREEEHKARIEVERAVRARMQSARDRTNAAVFRARTTHKVNISVVAELGFGNSNRMNVYKRVEEYQASHPEVVAAVDGGHYVAPVAGLEVRRDGSNVIVVFDHFSHVDLGDDINGVVKFNGDGEEIEHDSTLDPHYDAQPLWGLLVYQLPEVLTLA